MNKRTKKKIKKRVGFKTYRKYDAFNEFTIRLTIPTELDMTSLRESYRTITNIYGELSEKIIEAFRPLILAFGNFRMNGYANMNGTLGRPTSNPQISDMPQNDLKSLESVKSILTEYHDRFADTIVNGGKIPKELLGYDIGSGSDATGWYKLNFKADIYGKDIDCDEKKNQEEAK